MRILAAAGILLMCLAGGDAELSKEGIDIAKETKKTEVAQAKAKILDLEKRRATAAKSGNNMAVLLLANDIQLAKKRLAFVSKKTVEEYAREISQAEAVELIEQMKVDELMKDGVTAKKIETFGKELTGKRIQLSAQLDRVSDTWVKSLLNNDEQLVGLMVRDKNGDLFQFVVANKEKYGLILLEMKRGQDIQITGKILRVEDTFFLFAEDIQQIGEKN